MALTASGARYEEISRVLAKGIIHPGEKLPGEGTGDSPFEVRLQSSLLATLITGLLFFISFYIEMPRIPSWSDQVVSATVVETEVVQPQPTTESAPPRAAVEAAIEKAIGVQEEPRTLTLKTYKVQAGDTLWDLVGTHWPTVCEINGIRDCDLIFTGKVIEIPQRFLLEKERQNE